MWFVIFNYIHYFFIICNIWWIANNHINKIIDLYGGEYYIDPSRKNVSITDNVNATDEWLFATVIFKGEIYTLSYNLMDKTYKFFNRTKEGMRFLPELFHDNIMYKYVESTSLSDFVNRDVLDLESRKQYDAIMEHDGLAIIKYTLK